MAQILLFCESSPRHIFIVLKASKGLRKYLTDDWWKTFWERHRLFLTNKHEGRSIPYRFWYLRPNAFSSLRPAQYSHILRLCYGLRCEVCHCRFHHHVNQHLKKRICTQCKQDNFISNRVLYFRYGLNASEIVSEFGHLLCYTGLHSYSRTNELFEMSRQEIDMEVLHNATKNSKHTRSLMFFWKPDLERIFDLERERKRQITRVNAAKLLSARVRAFHVTIVMELI